MSQAAETAHARLRDSPPALRAHALLVLAAAMLVGAGQDVLFYSYVVIVAFVSPTTIGFAAVLLAAAWALLLTPVVRRYCDVAPRAPLHAVGLALAAVLVGPCQALALSVEPLLPSWGNFERTRNLVHLGTDPGAPSVFYVGSQAREVCVVVLEPRSSSRSCRSRKVDLDHVHGIRTEHVEAWVLPETAVRADVVYDGGVKREAESLYRPGAIAKVFYTIVALDDVRGIEAYDATGDRIVHCRFCDLPVEVDP